MPRYRVIPARLNVRAGPGTDRAVVGQLAAGAVIEPAGSVDTTAGDTWHALRITSVGGAELVQPAEPTFVYAAHRYQGDPLTELVAETPTPAPTPTPLPAQADTFSRRMVGVHLITNRGAAPEAYAAGARVFVFLGNKLEAVQFKQGHPDATVIYRAWLGNSWPSPEDMVRALAPNAGDPPIVFLGLNENDQAGCDSAAIRARGAWDAEVARRIKAIQPNAEYLAGSFAHGTPDLTSGDVCQAIREAYAPGYNAGLFGFDLHNYTKGWIREVSPIWFERRWEMLFTKCGFDPTIRNIWSSETGVEAGAGGFAWGMNAGRIPVDAVVQWLDYNDGVQRSALLIDGELHNSPYRGAAIFTYLGPGWEGYWFPLTQAASYWAGAPESARRRSASLADIGSPGEPPPFTIPPRKVLVSEGPR